MAAIFQRVPWRSLNPINFGPETDGKHQDPHAAPARDQEMPQFVKKHDQAEDEQKGNEVADHAAPKRM